MGYPRRRPPGFEEFIPGAGVRRRGTKIHEFYDSSVWRRFRANIPRVRLELQARPAIDRRVTSVPHYAATTRGAATRSAKDRVSSRRIAGPLATRDVPYDTRVQVLYLM